ncbi:hypothetical protein CPB84DRAFT_1958338 [Gymnopilus junonius]|uniref:Uncharacterized protein n=1 Tax=Gymnopilus junonius TaxID=109634 RepID=A0A9P5P064_GYMJU|nr:hypothetical protein CPB84DRAFT_1958338 [Gymnopilus junonius]
MYVSFSERYSQKRDRNTTIMISFSIVMFIIATFHLAMNCYRLIHGYIWNGNTPDGPANDISDLARWDHILKDTLYATQENLGSAAAIYRCWVLWNRDWRVVAFPIILLGINLVAGYIVCGTYASITATQTVFNDRLNKWIKTFYSIAVVLNIITTSLMSYRIWITHRRSANYQVGKGRLLTVLRILVESAALQLVVEMILLALYSEQIIAQYIVLESVASIVGITFNTITVRMKFQALAEKGSSSGSQNHVHTIGSMPMRRINVTVNKETEDDFLAEGGLKSLSSTVQ